MPVSAGAAAWLLALSAGAAVIMVLIVAAVRVATTVRRRLDARAHGAAMQLLLRVADGEPLPAPSGRRLTEALGRAAAEMVHKVRGGDRQALAEWLTATGYRETAQRRMSSRLATRRARGIELYLAATSGEHPGPVVDLLRDRHAGVRATAVRALGGCGVEAAVPALVAAVAARRRAVSASAAAMAIMHAAPSSAASLELAWRSGDLRVRRLAVDISGHLGLADARQELEATLTADDAALRTHAARALGSIGSPQSVDALSSALRRAPDASAEAVVLREVLDGIRIEQVSP